MGHIFNTERKSKPAKRAQKPVRSASKENMRRFQFSMVSLQISTSERKMIEEGGVKGLFPRVKQAVEKGEVYEDFASTPQKPNRAVFMLRAAEASRKFAPALMRVSHQTNEGIVWSAA